MTTDQLLEIVQARGMAVVLLADGSPALHGTREAAEGVSEKLLEVLRLPVHREEIVRRLRGGLNGQAGD